ncbi:TIGR01777 family oxidoreductase [Metabacillus malikii]|uniref:Uncharacterized protein (TIGR01777 family) n=1 Tax=Metabacillus malikii TaxID=1504265 RepID=A0ABT9ZJL5_9BACI|nr:TIGR01777 family oxidoreductase [Metabacillus malikii]MDQ0231738.1 uncharacterized protein (TIGR01777 family) [Metabacillus malikii]
MNIVICGGTGFIGKSLTRFYLEKNHNIIILTRSEKTSEEKNLTYINIDEPTASLVNKLNGCDVFINLAGKSINDRWTKKSKQEIRDSRIQTTDKIYAIIKSLPIKPSLYINASAIGIYGTSLTDTFSEATTSYGNDFLANTVKAWEQSAAKFNQLPIRNVFARFGIVLGDEGALPKMVLPFKWYAGGNLGTGEQWVSWIHIDDVVRLFDFIINTPSIEGPVNFTAPEQVKMKDFGKQIASIAHRPFLLPAPTFLLKIVLGEMSILILEGQKVQPQKALDMDFQYKYPTLRSALTNLLHT